MKASAAKEVLAAPEIVAVCNGEPCPDLPRSVRMSDDVGLLSLDAVSLERVSAAARQRVADVRASGSLMNPARRVMGSRLPLTIALLGLDWRPAATARPGCRHRVGWKRAVLAAGREQRSEADVLLGALIAAAEIEHA